MLKTFEDVCRSFEEGKDFTITVRHGYLTRAFMVAAIHGGYIEPHTSEIATLVAGNDHGLYLFEGHTRPSFENFHITSNDFNEPKFNEVATQYQRIVTIHGCKDEYGYDFVLGGRDYDLVGQLNDNLKSAGMNAVKHINIFQGLNPQNVCNRGILRRGAQIEISRSMRENVAMRGRIINVIRETLENFGQQTRDI